MSQSKKIVYRPLEELRPKGQKPELLGRIHSTESFGTVDGPGIRFVVFFQGCQLRCLYCHNRDSWDLRGGRLVHLEELMAEIRSYKPFYLPNQGGVTASGGEATLQAPFVTSLFEACHAEGLSTCLDTNGLIACRDSQGNLASPAKEIEAMLAVSDLVLLDIKHMEEQAHRRLTGLPNAQVLDFARYLDKIGKPVWIRHVVLPGWTDSDESAHGLGKFLSQLSNIKKLDLLPYHSMGAYKWHDLGDQYKLEGVPSPSSASMNRLRDILKSYGLDASYNS